jgi:hypothetical protein
MEIWNPNFLSASMIRKLQEMEKEFQKFIETVSTGENALTEEEVSEMKVRYVIKNLLEVLENFKRHPFASDEIRDKWFQEILSKSLTPEGKRAIIENLLLVEKALHEIEEEEIQKKGG